MHIAYTVHSVSSDPMPVTASFNGAEIPATVESLTVELVDQAGLHGHTFRFCGADLPEAKAMFIKGATIQVEFVPG